MLQELNKIAKPIGCAVLQYPQNEPRCMSNYGSPYQVYHGDPICVYNSVNTYDFAYFPHIPQHNSHCTKPLDKPQQDFAKEKEKDQDIQKLSDEIWRQLDS